MTAPPRRGAGGVPHHVQPQTRMRAALPVLALASVVLCTAGLMLLHQSSQSIAATRAAPSPPAPPLAPPPVSLPPVSADAIWSAPERRPASAHPGLPASFCGNPYLIGNWEGKNVPACDAGLCAGRDGLANVTAPARQVRRWSAADEKAYWGMFTNNSIQGWVQSVHFPYVKTLTDEQHKLGIWGAVGEIGVHQGKFAAPLIGYADWGEPAYAFDLFEDQDSNVDMSGKGSRAALLSNLRRCGIADTAVTLIKANSMGLSAAALHSLGVPKFRLLSVDGGHTLEVTLHDLQVASCALLDGGIVILDDVINDVWIGVVEALVHFTAAQSRLVPFLMGFNKIYLTTAEHAPLYAAAMARSPSVFKCQKYHESRRSLGGHVLCYTGPKT